jgi:hypothetical protein
MTPLSIQDYIQKFRSVDKSRKKAKATSIYGDVGRRQQRTTKDGNTSIDLLFSNTNASKFAFNLN